MQEKTWYYEKWVGRHASFPPSRYVNTLHVTTPFAEKDLRKAKYIAFMHLYDCWCISSLYRLIEIT
jgi:hypothetical protein